MPNLNFFTICKKINGASQLLFYLLLVSKTQSGASASIINSVD